MYVRIQGEPTANLTGVIKRQRNVHAAWLGSKSVPTVVDEVTEAGVAPGLDAGF